jgi:hypothetical protein
MNSSKYASPELQFMADLAFLRANPEEFVVRGRFSLTCMLRTLASLNPDMSAPVFIALCNASGINTTTARIQFAASRKLDAELA